jgi:hypothetical protein
MAVVEAIAHVQAPYADTGVITFYRSLVRTWS